MAYWPIFKNRRDVDCVPDDEVPARVRPLLEAIEKAASGDWKDAICEIHGDEVAEDYEDLLGQCVFCIETLIAKLQRAGIVPTEEFHIPTAPSFNEAVRQVIGVTDLILRPEITNAAMQNKDTAAKIRDRHAEIANTSACRAAHEAVAMVQRKLDGGETPKDMGFKTAIEAVHDTWRRMYQREAEFEAAEGRERKIDAERNRRRPKGALYPI